MAESKGITGKQILDGIFKVFSLIGLAAIGWIYNVSVDTKMATKDIVRIEREHADDITEMKEKLAATKAIADRAEANSIAVVRMEGTLDNMKEKISDIKDLVKSLGD